MTIPCNNIFVHRLKQEFFRLSKLGRIFNGKRNGNGLRCGEDFSVNGLMVDIYHKFTDQGFWSGNRFSYTGDFGPTSIDSSCPQCVYSIFSRNSHTDIKAFLFNCENAALSVCRDFFERIEDFKPKNNYNTEIPSSETIFLLDGQTPHNIRNFLVTGQKELPNNTFEMIYKNYEDYTEAGARVQFFRDSTVKGFKIITVKEKRKMGFV